MGKATKWLKGIFGIKPTTKDPPSFPSGDRKRPSFGHSGRDSGTGGKDLCNNPTTIPPNISASEAAWLKSYYASQCVNNDEHNKHAIAVAAATAAAADAAVAAAQAAVAVVRLTTNHARGGGGGGGGGVEKWAAVKIQTTFRGYLARKALRALKGLVKIQALVRGYLVRKQATATLHGMQALIRAQATVRSRRAQAQTQAHVLAHLPYLDYSHPDFRARRSMEMYDDTRSEHGSASLHSRRLSSSFENRSMNPITEDIPKIVEVDPGRPRSSRASYSRPSGPTHFGSDYGEPDPYHPPRLSIPACNHFQDSEWSSAFDECCRPSTAHSTPRFKHSGIPNSGPLTPCKSVCGGESGGYYYGHYGNFNSSHPNYMANTQSSRAKVRSHSAPKQRPEPGSRKRLTLNEMIESRSSLSGVKMQRSCSQVQEVINFKNAVMGKLDRSYDFGRDGERYNMQRKY